MIQPNAYKTGLIAAGITIAYTLIAYLIGIDLFTNFWIPMLVVVGILVYMILSLKKIRENLGFMSFKDGFLNFAVMAVLYVFISQIFYFLLINVIDPDFGVAVSDTIIEKAVGMMERFGAPESEIEKSLIEMEENFESQSTFGGAFIGWIKYLSFVLVVGLIAAAVLKSKKTSIEIIEEVE